MDGTWISLEKEDILRNILEKLKNKGKKFFLSLMRLLIILMLKCLPVTFRFILHKIILSIL